MFFTITFCSTHSADLEQKRLACEMMSSSTDFMAFQVLSGTADGPGTKMSADSSCRDQQHKKCRLHSTSNIWFSIFFVLDKGVTSECCCFSFLVF